MMAHELAVLEAPILAVAREMGLATGHGDTPEDMIRELVLGAFDLGLRGVTLRHSGAQSSQAEQSSMTPLQLLISTLIDRRSEREIRELKRLGKLMRADREPKMNSSFQEFQDGSRRA